MGSLAPAEKAPAGKSLKVGSGPDVAQRKPDRSADAISASDQQATPPCAACAAGEAPCPACGGKGGAGMLQRKLLGSQNGGSFIQAKLTVSQPGDAQELEADRVADTVMRMSDSDGRLPNQSLKSATMTTPSVQPLSVESNEEASKNGNITKQPGTGRIGQIQRMESTMKPRQSSESDLASITTMKAGGSPLPLGTRTFFEPRFGADFSQVRVHTDAHAARAASSIRAKAFTMGRDIAFGDAEYQPDSADGQRLLAHELTHVVQQGAATPAGRDAAPNAAAIAPARTRQVQRDFLDDAQTFAGGALDTLGSVVDDAGRAISSGVSSVIDNGSTSLGGAAQATASAAGGIVDWIKTEAGKLALRSANALAAKFGGSIVISPKGGIDILIGDINIAELEEETHILPLGLPVDTLFDAPFEVGTFIINTSVGTVIGDPELTTAVGPVRLQEIKLHFDPFKDVYSGTGQLFIGAEAVGAAEKALELRVQAIGVLPFEPPIPIETSAVVGLRDIVRLAGKGNLRDTVDLRYSAGKFTVGRFTQLKLGALAQLDHEAFLRIEVEGTEICSLIWPLSSRRLGSAGVQIDMPLQLTADGDGIRAVTGEASAEKINDVDTIETSLKNNRPTDHCLKLDEFAKFLCEKAKLPPDVCSILAPASPRVGGGAGPVTVVPFGPHGDGQIESKESNKLRPPGQTCPESLPIRWPLELPIPEDEELVRRGGEDDSKGNDRGPAQRRLAKLLKQHETDCKDGIDEPAPEPCFQDDAECGHYDAHHPLPVFLGGVDEEPSDSICALIQKRHQIGHRRLNDQRDQAESDPVWINCGVTQGNLPSHGSGQNYHIAETK